MISRQKAKSPTKKKVGITLLCTTVFNPETMEKCNNSSDIMKVGPKNIFPGMVSCKQKQT